MHVCRIEMLNKEHPVYLETVTFRNIMKFTALQVAYLFMVWGVTWAGAIGIAFPFLIVLVIPARQYLMPKFFDRWTLSQLDTAEYEHAASAPSWVCFFWFFWCFCHCRQGTSSSQSHAHT